ncbi:related to DNA repair protein rad9 [Ustilago bromivora]|uniref:Related to DNA repair protein rad9 n=1 Tax=Ustilago bromivora TaxID=307758 RepID=A0A1K0G7L9_9BASI|nr:related to DNA repair protein rad9 [Ustilago bromivora]SYW73785.1 related to DNA repair protein rad9 [Ustilago bromivora]
MNALISASDIKTFYSALYCLSRFSETFWLQCSPKIGGQSQIRLSAINPTNSAFCMFVFDPDFFLSVTTESSSKLECQIQLKSILSILRTRGRAVERLSLTLSPDSAPIHRFTITLHCHHSITKSHNLTYSPKRGLLPTADPNPPNFFCIHPSTASEWLDHFLSPSSSSSRSGEITLHCAPNSCIARSKEDEIPTHTTTGAGGGIRKCIATEVKIATEDFKEYAVLEEAKLTFSLREFKATVALAEGWGTGLEVNFSDGDEPLFVRMKSEGGGVAGEFVIATTRGDRTGAGAGTEVRDDPGQEQGHGQQRETPQQHEQRPIAASARSSNASASRIKQPHRQASASMASGQGETSLPSHPQPVTPLAHAIPTESTPHPQHLAKHPEDEGDADETQPLFFPGASQLSLQPTPQESAGEREPEQTLVQPTPVAQGGDPSEFLPSQSSSAPSTQQQQQQHQRDAFRTESDSDADSEQDDERGGMPRKRFKPLF